MKLEETEHIIRYPLTIDEENELERLELAENRLKEALHLAACLEDSLRIKVSEATDCLRRFEKSIITKRAENDGTLPVG